MAKFKFEEAIERLEEIVRQLEEGSLGLDESLKLFDEGIRLTQLCTKKLEESERKIQILLKNEQGEKSLQPYQIDEEEEELELLAEAAEETALKKEESLE
ncbi:MAG: exodeoxyribonuclease VII small subunit [bacterium]|nr:exodeoxyribonuclease VII small subunit [bacterium]